MKKVVFALLGYFSLTFVNAQEKIGLGNITPDSMLTVSGGIRTTTGIVTGSDATINGMQIGKGGGNISSNLAMGFQALNSNTSGVLNIAIGTRALRDNLVAGSNSAIGSEALMKNTTGIQNTAIASFSLSNNTIGNNNTAIGSVALYNNIASSNTAIGAEAMRNNTTGIQNTAIASYALFSNTTSGNNTAVGSVALYANTGSDNSAIGAEAMRNSTTGIQNTAVGSYGLFSNTTGSYNTAIGSIALYNNVTGSNNTAIGIEAGRFTSSGANNQSSNTSIYIGNYTRSSANGSDNEVVIGYQSRGQGSNSIMLGNSSITNLYCYDTSISSPSDKRDKKDIEPLEIGLEFLKKIEPVAFTWNMRDGGKKDVRDLGFIAQQVKPAQDMERQGQNLSLVHYQSGEDRYFMQYSNLIPVLVKAVKEQQVQIDKLNSQIIALNKQLAVMAVENSTSNVVEKKSKR